jgi:hypothetical protein
MAAAFAVGFAGARLLKGSSQQSGDWSGDSRRSEMSGERWGRYPGSGYSGYDTSQSGGGSFGSAGYASSAFGGAGFGSDYPPSGAGAGSSSSYGNGDTSRPESGAGYSGAWSGGSRSAGTGSYEAGSTATGSGSTEGGDALLGSDWSARGTGSLSEER